MDTERLPSDRRTEESDRRHGTRTAAGYIKSYLLAPKSTSSELYTSLQGRYRRLPMADSTYHSNKTTADDSGIEQLGYRATHGTPESTTSDTPLAGATRNPSARATRFAPTGLPPGATNAPTYPPTPHEGIELKDPGEYGSSSEKVRPRPSSKRFSSSFAAGSHFDTRDASQDVRLAIPNRNEVLTYRISI